MEYTTEFERKRLILALSATQLAALFLTGAFFIGYLIFVEPFFPGNKMVPIALLLGLIFLVSVIALIVMTVIFWRKKRWHAADRSGRRES